MGQAGQQQGRHEQCDPPPIAQAIGTNEDAKTQKETNDPEIEVIETADQRVVEDQRQHEESGGFGALVDGAQGIARGASQGQTEQCDQNTVGGERRNKFHQRGQHRVAKPVGKQA